MGATIKKIEEVVLDFYRSHGFVGHKKPTVADFRGYVDALGIELEEKEFLSLIYKIGLRIKERGGWDDEKN